jgi:uncharacterized secreted protein with C-terminal beta-propeller domain
MTFTILRPDNYLPEISDVEVRDTAAATEVRNELSGRLIDGAVERYRDILGQEVYNRYLFPVLTRCVLEVSAAFSAVDSSAADFSGTNTQEAGVDEADLIETDGEFLYLASGRELSIVRTTETNELESVTSIELSGQIHGLFLNGEVLTVVSRWVSSTISDENQWFAPDRVAVSVFDVSDRGAPSMTGQTVLDGYYHAARQVQGDVYLVLRNRGLSIPAPKVIPVDDAESGANTTRYVESIDSALIDTIYYDHGQPGGRYETEAEYRASLEKLFQTAAIPQAYSVELEDGVPVLVGERLTTDPDLFVDSVSDNPWSRHGHQLTRYGQQLTTVVSIDTTATQNAVIDSVTVQGRPDVYMTESSLYLFGYEYPGVVIPSNGLFFIPYSTTVTRFELGSAALNKGEFGDPVQGVVPGRVLNSFSLDEAEGYLRIATTTNVGTQSESAVYTLQEQDGALVVTAGVTGIGVGQQMYAARFIGSRAYLITFQRIDPLHVIDLSDPLNPVELGELEIPGFSNYLQPLDDDHLIGIGRDASNYLQVSLFDVSDPTNPLLIDQYSFEDSWRTNSDAVFDHHAVSLFAEHGRLVIPLQSWGYEFDEDGRWTWSTDQQFAVLSIDPTNGIDLEGEVQHDSRPRRSLRIGDNLITFSDESVKSHNLENVAEQRSELTIAGLVENTISHRELLDGLITLRENGPAIESPAIESPAIESPSTQLPDAFPIESLSQALESEGQQSPSPGDDLNSLPVQPLQEITEESETSPGQDVDTESSQRRLDIEQTPQDGTDADAEDEGEDTFLDSVMEAVMEFLQIPS